MSKKTLSPSAKRVEFLVEKLAAGSQRNLGVIGGVSHTTIAKIVSGQQHPGRKVLERLASIPTVNRDWLLNGIGNPLSETSLPAPSFTVSIPLARSLIPGDVRNYRHLLTPRAINVPLVSAGAAVYAVEIAAWCPFSQRSEEGIRIGDILILDSDPDAWKSNTETLDGRLVVVKRITSQGLSAELHRGNLKSDVDDDLATDSIESEVPDFDVTASRRQLDLKTAAVPAVSPEPTSTEPSTKFPANSQQIAADGVVAVVKLLVRIF